MLVPNPEPTLVLAVTEGIRVARHGVGVGVGVGDATGVGVGVGVIVPHLTSIKAAWNELAARNLKLVGSAGLGTVKVTTTGLIVPGINAGIITTALTTEPGTTVSDCKPVPALTWSTVTEPGPPATAKETGPPGNKSPSVTVVLGVQVCIHRTRIKAAWNVLAARRVKSTACPGLGVVNVTTTGLNVPGANGGMLTTALTGTPTSVSDCKPVPALT
jgi:hypothetical protein